MPTLSSLLFNSNNNTLTPSNKQMTAADQPQHLSINCCSCACHSHNEPNENSNSPTTMIFTPTKWFPRIRRRSSSSSSTTTTCSSLFSSIQQQLHHDEGFSSQTSSHNSSRRQSVEYMNEIEDKKQIKEFEELYKLAVDEMAYAIESQESIYYSGDLTTATEAVDACLDRFRHLMQTLNTDRSHTFQREWTDILFELRSRLDSLPFPEDDY